MSSEVWLAQYAYRVWQNTWGNSTFLKWLQLFSGNFQSWGYRHKLLQYKFYVFGSNCILDVKYSIVNRNNNNRDCNDTALSRDASCRTIPIPGTSSGKLAILPCVHVVPVLMEIRSCVHTVCHLVIIWPWISSSKNIKESLLPWAIKRSQLICL